MKEQLGPFIRDSGDPDLIQRVREHLGEEFLNMTTDIVAGYHDGGHYGGPPDPRSRAAFAAHGRTTSRGGSGPKKSK